MPITKIRNNTTWRNADNDNPIINCLIIMKIKITINKIKIELTFR